MDKQKRTKFLAHGAMAALLVAGAGAAYFYGGNDLKNNIKGLAVISVPSQTPTLTPTSSPTAIPAITSTPTPVQATPTSTPTNQTSVTPALTPALIRPTLTPSPIPSVSTPSLEKKAAPSPPTPASEYHMIRHWRHKDWKPLEKKLDWSKNLSDVARPIFVYPGQAVDVFNIQSPSIKYTASYKDIAQNGVQDYLTSDHKLITFIAADCTPYDAVVHKPASKPHKPKVHKTQTPKPVEKPAPAPKHVPKAKPAPQHAPHVHKQKPHSQKYYAQPDVTVIAPNTNIGVNQGTVNIYTQPSQNNCDDLPYTYDTWFNLPGFEEGPRAPRTIVEKLPIPETHYVFRGTRDEMPRLPNDWTPPRPVEKMEVPQPTMPTPEKIVILPDLPKSRTEFTAMYGKGRTQFTATTTAGKEVPASDYDLTQLKAQVEGFSKNTIWYFNLTNTNGNDAGQFGGSYSRFSDNIKGKSIAAGVDRRFSLIGENGLGLSLGARGEYKDLRTWNFFDGETSANTNFYGTLRAALTFGSFGASFGQAGIEATGQSSILKLQDQSTVYTGDSRTDFTPAVFARIHLISDNKKFDFDANARYGRVSTAFSSNGQKLTNKSDFGNLTLTGAYQLFPGFSLVGQFKYAYNAEEYSRPIHMNNYTVNKTQQNGMSGAVGLRLRF